MKKSGAKINAVSDEITITGVILQADEAVLVENRLNEETADRRRGGADRQTAERRIRRHRSGVAGTDGPDALQSIRDRDPAWAKCRRDAHSHTDRPKA